MQEMTFNQLLFIVLIPLLAVPFTIGIMLLVSKGTLKMDTLLGSLSAKLQKATRKLTESRTGLSQEPKIDIAFIPDSFFENIKTDKSRPRRELLLMSLAFMALTYFYAKIYAIYLCLAVVAVKAISFRQDIMDIDRFVIRELSSKHATKNYSFVGWGQLGSRFNYINIALLLILLAGRYSTYLYLTKTRLIIAMGALFVFAITRLVKFREYINQIHNLYAIIAQSEKTASLNTTVSFPVNILEALGIGAAITFAIYLLSLDTLPIRLIMYVTSFGCIYFTGKSLYGSRRLFYRALIEIDSNRKQGFLTNMMY